MSSTPDEVLALASRLLNVDDHASIQEVDLRCSTSRAYYAALHAADLALPEDLAPPMSALKGRSSHQVIIDAVLLWAKGPLRPGRMEAIKIARDLPRLRDARKKADYKLELDFSLDDAKEALRIAKATLDNAGRAAQRAAGQQA